MTLNLFDAHLMFASVFIVRFILTLCNYIIKWQNRTKQFMSIGSIGGDTMLLLLLFYERYIETFESNCYFHAAQPFIHVMALTSFII